MLFTASSTVISSDAVNRKHSPDVFAVVNMKACISLLLITLVLFVTQPNTGQCAPTEISLLKKIHCALITANIQREQRQDGNNGFLLLFRLITVLLS